MRIPKPFYLLLFPLLFVSQHGLSQNSVNEEDIGYVLDRYVKNMGGRASLERIRSVRLNGTIQYPNGMKHAITVIKKKPNLVRIVLDTGTMRFIQAYDGNLAWFSRETGNQAFYDRMRGKQAASFIHEAPLENTLIDPGESGAVFVLGPEVSAAGLSCYQIITRFPDGSKTIHHVDKDNFMERRILHYDEKGVLLSEMIPSKFQTVDGVVFAMQLVRLNGNEKISTLLIESVLTNDGVLESAFSPPVELPEN